MKKSDHDPEYSAYLNSLPREMLLSILENCYNEIFVNDRDGRIVYVNPACIRHYGLKPEDLVHAKNADVFQGNWTPMALDYAIDEKRIIFAKQRFIPAGEELVTILTPVLDESGNIELIIGNVQENEITHWDVSYKDDDLKTSRRHKSSHFNSNETPIISRSFNYWKIITELKQVSDSTIPVLLLGESGTGKTYVAEYIHENSGRDGLFITLNCTAIPESLLESELFGYAPGAFTGASSKGKIGLIEMASNGTLFLDEIGDLPLYLQAKLLDVLENQRYIPVGGTKMKYVNIRIITATNKDIDTLVKEGKFREDLYWRISTFNTILPPLRKRRDDILPLSNFFLKLFNEKYEKNKTFSQEVLSAFMRYSWPGNVRQLKNMIERLVVVTMGNIIDLQKLPETMLRENHNTPDNSALTLDERVEALKKDIVRDAYRKNQTVRRAAAALGITASKAQRLIKEYCGDLQKENEG